jgi:hypothetical protein
MPNISKEPQSPVSKDRAQEHALLAVRRAWAGDAVGLEGWGTAELDAKPVEIHDLNGKLLFYEFAAMRGNQSVGYVKTSASKTLGTPVPAIIIGKRGWDPSSALKGGAEQAAKLFPKGKITEQELVCYSYPKIGVLTSLRAPNQEHVSIITDVASHSVVSRFGVDELEGQTCWSFYGELMHDEAARREAMWEAADRELEAAKVQTPRALESAFTERDLADAKAAVIPQPTPSLPGVVVPFYSQQVIQYCRHCSTHDCYALHAQQTDVYCAVATGQMILDYYRHSYSQADIAAAMGTGAGGTANEGQKTGYEKLSNKCLEATIDLTADWAEAKAEIDANRPLKSGISGHARACFGWKRQNITLVGRPAKRWLFILDPWPWNADLCAGGAVVWEDWDAVNHTNFIYVRHRTTPCS